MKNLGAAFLEIFKSKEAKYDKTLKIHRNGVDNNYPDLVEALIENSVTATLSANLMASYISGKGFGDDPNKLIVHKEKGTTLLQFAQEIADSIANHRGVFIHVNYDGNLDHKDFDVLPFSDCRLGKQDDNKYNGKILVSENWTDIKKAKAAKVVDVYNPDKKVLKTQIRRAKSLERYNGQIFYFKYGKKTYPLSPIHPCLEDADSEKQVSKYKNTSLRKGFFGKTLVVTKPLVDGSLKDVDPDEFKEQEDARDKFRETIQKFIGAENADGVLHLEMEFEGDKIEKEILFKNIESNIDDKIFAHTETSVSDNIRMCFNNVPAALIRSKDGALFGQSGEAIQQMKIFYQDQTFDERSKVEEIVNKLMKKFQEPVENLKIVPLIEVETKAEELEKDPDAAKKEAQAILKGSVGGVTALLQIQQSVAAGTTERSAAIAIIEEIYGITAEKAAEMLGTPKEENNDVDRQD
ncbi:hypothetical protein SAMN06296241_1357 [Salinimicrobium sediminis]|uniref:Phage portal protein, SPP1 family n=1 Tax=Salinimicrobium sediminis TaxID=1343891 RepID=A0A285X380_9FLAO|nr:hypothetical protein [Salinimicrobium sediminis]SOC79820.1 hypothetical protein SAMN06296241_1357 [Salinimicrobium sediminis]